MFCIGIATELTRKLSGRKNGLINGAIGRFLFLACFGCPHFYFFSAWRLKTKSLWKFSWLTFSGSFIWSAFLTYLGLMLGKNWQVLHIYFQKFDYMIVGIIVVAIIWFCYDYYKRDEKIIIIILFIIVLGLFIKIYFIFNEKNQLRDKFESLSVKGYNLIKENNKIESDIEYFSNKDNLGKELRSKFNYKNIGEKMMIIIP